ncbi:CBS domain-containing protein [Paenibacillus sp. 481]|uniref:CBS domain-containing protein n=1 Tax=Paenibacillus sp. 481 TaxID=2835869 RepID=UPI001E584BE0|nr:CBS domain-containing protein [Paenibacillus sp. 481]UHA74050.1 CBS domain-containing protein [Paenibacillus sp. 481]
MANVKDVMTTSCATLTVLDNVFEAAVLMKQYDTGFIPVVDGERLIGVVTDRDLVVRGIAEKHPGSEQITHVMTHDVITIDPDLSVDEAAQLMAEKQVRRLPVAKNGKLIGIVSLGDLAVRSPFVNEAGDALSEISESPYTH